MTTHPSALIAQLRKVADAQKDAEKANVYCVSDDYERVHFAVRGEVEALRPLLIEAGIDLHYLREAIV